mmetsp:Transcript_15560/g.37079  ORF Transcript_15560/g.37079 Transcript_15560/m.37079 type:complete len:217 (+) Transcript_15560:1367-2017(+)
MVCSIWCGKCLRVHSGMLSSGGSCESPYDWVMCGNTTWTLALVPSVPDSSRGFRYHTQRWSTYKRACMLSSALTVQSSESQKASLKVSSVSGPTRTSLDSTFSSLFISSAAAAAVLDFGLPTCSFLKRNCLLRFETSMRSMSVTVSLPLPPQQTPMSAKFFKNSQPNAPAPTRKIFMLASFCWKTWPNMAIWSSYRELVDAVSVASSLPRHSNAST